LAWKEPEVTPMLDLLRRDFERMWEETNGNDQCRRVLDFTCEKYRVKDWREFVPTRLHAHVPGRLPHATTISDDFTRADGDAIGNLLTWSELSGDFDTVSNRIRTGAGGGGVSSLAQATSDLSSTDHYSQVAVYPSALDSGPAARAQAGPTAYIAVANSGLGNFRLYKLVAGAFTQLGSTVGSITWANADTVKTEANGSSISAFRNSSSLIGPVSDSAISSGVRCGVWSFSDNVGDLDDFEAADLIAPPATTPKRLMLLGCG
jgi:hypothetical protein